MGESPPEWCARCGETIQGRLNSWILPFEWRIFLKDEHDLRWFPNGPAVILCSECDYALDDLHYAISDLRAQDGDGDRDTELEVWMRNELAALDFEAIVDENKL